MNKSLLCTSQSFHWKLYDSSWILDNLMMIQMMMKKNFNWLDNKVILCLKQKIYISKDMWFLFMEIYEVYTIQCEYILCIFIFFTYLINEHVLSFCACFLWKYLQQIMCHYTLMNTNHITHIMPLFRTME